MTISIVLIRFNRSDEELLIDFIGELNTQHGANIMEAYCLNVGPCPLLRKALLVKVRECSALFKTHCHLNLNQF